MIEILKDRIRLFASDNNWVESVALMQLEHTGNLEGMKLTCGMPDIHPGKGGPVGAAFLSRFVYPHIIGNDAGCGVGLFMTSLKSGKIKTEKWAKKLKNLENPSQRDVESFALDRCIDLMEYKDSFGTIGGGNHFAELQKIKEVFDEKEFEKAGLNNKFLNILVHSGSRGLGELLYRSHTKENGASYIEPESSDEKDFIRKQNEVVKWASASRELIAERFIDQLGGSVNQILDTCHNSIEEKTVDGKKMWLHRKGAVAADRGLVVVPGSRGSLSYLVKPEADCEKSLWSIAHGSGRKWNRGNCRGRLEAKWGVKDLERTDLGSVVICRNKGLLYEEAPQAYKNIDMVIQDMIDDGLIRKIAAFEPVITYKTRKK